MVGTSEGSYFPLNKLGIKSPQTKFLDVKDIVQNQAYVAFFRSFCQELSKRGEAGRGSQVSQEIFREMVKIVNLMRYYGDLSIIRLKFASHQYHTPGSEISTWKEFVMFSGNFVLSQIMDHLPWPVFHQCVAHYSGDKYIETFNCFE